MTEGGGRTIDDIAALRGHRGHNTNLRAPTYIFIRHNYFIIFRWFSSAIFIKRRFSSDFIGKVPTFNNISLL